MSLNNFYLTDRQLSLVEETRANYRLFWEAPDRARPAILIQPPVPCAWSVRERTHDPEKMLSHQFNVIAAHLAVGDDYVPAARVEFGTGQVAHAYGCQMYEPEDSPPCSTGTAISSIEEAASLRLPALRDGWFGRLEQYTEFFRAHLPEGVSIQIPDIQGPFNNAHLVRGNDILYDFYDEPELLRLLLSRMTDQLIELTGWLRDIGGMSGEDDFCDWGCLWRGGVRISNCSLHMISTQFYRDFIREQDQRLIDSVGMGRIHYCGEHDDGLMDSFFEMPNMTGVDFDGQYHDLWALSARAPKQVTLLVYATPAILDRLLSGDWPQKRNIIIQAYVPSVEAGRDLYRRLTDSMR